MYFPKPPPAYLVSMKLQMADFLKADPVLICGSAGCGKTLFAAQFLVKGITEYNEPGVFMSFEETQCDLLKM